jgi:molybdopterin/thiamine biosynthesis adenylyltransferase
VKTAQDRLRYRGEYDDAAYWQRVDRNLAWLGENDAEARRNQEKLRDATIGIAGVGGIGGAVAMRLVRMGARHIKVADPDHFDLSNIQRQAGARLDTLGRNKAEVVAEMLVELTGDADVDVFPEGITQESAEEFVDGCDVVADQIEFYEADARFALHRAARASGRCKVILSVGTAGHGALIHKYLPDSMPVEEAWGLPEGAKTKEEIAAAFIDKLVPDGLVPDFPSREALLHWLLDKKVAPIWGAAPPLCEGVLVDLICNHVIGFPGMHDLPPIPSYSWIDMYSWKASVVHAEHEGVRG